MKENITNNKDLAVRLAHHCVRNTIIEDYHANGKLSQTDMKDFNIEVANKIYTILEILLNPKYKKFRDSPAFNRFFYQPAGWDKPTLDQEFMSAIESLEGQA